MEPQVAMTGNLVSDPTRRVTAAGVVVTHIRVASTGRRFDRGRGEWVSTDPVFLSVSCWRQLGDNVAQTLKKGDSVVVTGRVTMREYDDANGGPKRQSYEVDAISVGPDLSRYVCLLARPPRELAPVTADDGAPAADEALPSQAMPSWDPVPAATEAPAA
jgi:single-strand DNA-binding protein